MRLSFLFLALLLVTVCSNAQTLNPAPKSSLPDIKRKKLKPMLNDRWRVSGYDLAFSNLYFGTGTDDSGQAVFLHRYPETNLATGVTQVVADAKTFVADGHASSLTPDGHTYSAGAYRQGEPHGPWIHIRLDTVGLTRCAALQFDSPREQAQSILRTCYPDSATQARISVTTAEYDQGVLDGTATLKTLAGELLHEIEYQAGQPVGQEQQMPRGTWVRGFTVMHSAAGSDTTWTTPANPMRTPDADTLVERMPAFSAVECSYPTETPPSPDALQAFSMCSQKAMLEFIYTSIRYPTSSRRRGVEGMSVVTFVVERDGSLSEIRTAKFVSGPIDEESRRVIASMPPWHPGIQAGKPVRVHFNLPINYRLR